MWAPDASLAVLHLVNDPIHLLSQVKRAWPVESTAVKFLKGWLWHRKTIVVYVPGIGREEMAIGDARAESNVSIVLSEGCTLEVAYE